MNIIKSVDRVKAGLLSSEPVTTHDTSFVYKNSRGKFHVVENGGQLSRMDMRANGYSLRYSVSRKPVDYRHVDEYPSKQPGKTFRFSIQFRASVENPIKVVQNDITNIVEYINGNISFWFEPLLQNYSIEDFREVQQAIKQLSENTSLYEDLAEKGLKLSQLKANVRLNDRDWAHFKQIEDMKKTQELEKIKIQEQKELERLKFEEQQKIEKIRLQEEQELERIRLKEEQELERIRLERAKEIARMQAEIEEMNQEREMLRQQKEMLNQIKIEEMKNAQLQKEIERAKKAFQNGGSMEVLFETASGKEDIREIFLQEMKIRQENQQKLLDRFIKNGDFSDTDAMMKMMGALNESRPVQPELEMKQERIEWNAGNQKEEEKKQSSTSQKPEADWIDVDE